MPFLEFSGKAIVHAHHLGVPFRTLVPVPEQSVLPKGKGGKSGAVSEGANLLIHGDNLHALKALMPRYAGRVNCVCIDPPYNTGGEGWVYNDNVNSPLMRRWLKENGAVDREDLERHDKWLSMMWPRLRLLRDLMADDGCIFVFIDDNEQHRLRMMMDEIFGEGNFVANLVWRKKAGGGMDSQYFAREHDHILCYRGGEGFQLNFRTVEHAESDFPKTKDGRRCKFIKLEKWGSNARREDRPTMYYAIKDPDGKDFYPQAPDGKDGNWRTRPTALDKAHIHWEKKNGGRWTPHEVVYFDEIGARKKVVKERTIVYDLATTTDATEEQKALFGEKKFSNSKPVDLIARLIDLAGGKDAIVLDSFAGSGTTAHAVLALNDEDGGNRQFVLVECEDYAGDITAERIRRAIKGVPKPPRGQPLKGLGGCFSYCELGSAISEDELLSNGLPDYESLARYVAHTATGKTLEKIRQGKDWLIGEVGNFRLHLLYKPDADFLVSNESSLTRTVAERVGASARNKGKEALFFAPCKFISQRELTSLGVTFCHLPYALYGIFGNEAEQVG